MLVIHVYKRKFIMCIVLIVYHVYSHIFSFMPTDEMESCNRAHMKTEHTVHKTDSGCIIQNITQVAHAPAKVCVLGGGGGEARRYSILGLIFQNMHCKVYYLMQTIRYGSQYISTGHSGLYFANYLHFLIVIDQTKCSDLT